jgi:hypothetical protein
MSNAFILFYPIPLKWNGAKCVKLPGANGREEIFIFLTKKLFEKLGQIGRSKMLFTGMKWERDTSIGD